MASLMLSHSEETWLDTHTGRWVEAGLISPSQADGIRAFEHGIAPQRLTLAAEIASYIGSVLVLMGGAAVVARSWDDLPLIAQLGVALAVMAVGYTSGTWLMRLDEPGTRRLGSFLWAVGTGGVAMAVFPIIKEIRSDDDGVVAVTVGASVLAVSLALWRNRERPLQLITAVIGFGVVLGGLADITESPEWVGSIVLMAAGLSLAGGAVFRRLQPRLLAIGLGFVLAYIGGSMLASTSELLGPSVALAIAVLAVVIGLRERFVPLLVIGVAGSLIATGGLLSTAFDGLVAALVVTLLGLAIVATAIARTLRKPRTEGQLPASATTVTSGVDADRSRS